MCAAPNAKLCSSCHSIHYCTPTCQKLDWPLHKTVCQAFTSLPSRPSPAHRLAIHLPVSGTAPQLVFVKCDSETDSDDGLTYELADTDALLEAEGLDPKYKHAREFKPMMRNVLRGFDLGYTVQVVCRETFLVDGSSPNGCVRKYTKGRAAHDWRGPIVVMRQPGTAVDPLVHEDVRAADVRNAIDYFEWYGREA